MTKEAIHAADAPQAIGIYSQAIKCDKLVFLSGQIGLDPKSMTLVDGGFEHQLTQVISNLIQVAKAASGSLSDIVKVNVYLTDIVNFPKVNEIMEQYFSKPYPARAVVEVSGLPKGALVEIEAYMVLQ